MHPTSTCSLKTKHHLGNKIFLLCTLPQSQRFSGLAPGQTHIPGLPSWDRPQLGGYGTLLNCERLRFKLWLCFVQLSSRNLIPSQQKEVPELPVCFVGHCWDCSILLEQHGHALGWRQRVTPLLATQPGIGVHSSNPRYIRHYTTLLTELIDIDLPVFLTVLLSPPYPITCMLGHYPKKRDDEEQARSKARHKLKARSLKSCCVPFLPGYLRAAIKASIPLPSFFKTKNSNLI